ncbi:hypothetical protein RIR_jg11731.t1 [Rhizophagus irregularis DAOM 181602=DAOM 197198]|nr:hypothetical protein RIR_jg11731.t1 [Rhizophagus irregularis DAOM 181602=DAOM 197198]
MNDKSMMIFNGRVFHKAIKVYRVSPFGINFKQPYTTSYYIIALLWYCNLIQIVVFPLTDFSSGEDVDWVSISW